MQVDERVKGEWISQSRGDVSHGLVENPVLSHCRVSAPSNRVGALELRSLQVVIKVSDGEIHYVL